MESKKTIKHILEVAFSNCTSIFSGIIIGFLIPKILSVEGYGLYKTFTLYMTYAGFFSLGIIDGIVLEYGGYDFEQLDKRLFRAYWKFYAVIHIFFAAVLVIIAATSHNSDIRFIMCMLAINMIANNFTGYFQQISQITQRFGEYSFRKILQSSLSILTAILLYVGFSAGYTISYKIYVITVVFVNVNLVLWYFWTYRSIIFGKSCNFLLIKRNVFHLSIIGFPLLFANLCSTLILTLDRQFVNILFDTSTYAVYSFAYNMLSLVTVATSAVSTVIYPMLKRTDENKLMEKYSFFIEIVLIFVFAALVSYFPLCIFVAYFLPKYTMSLEIFRVVFPGLAVSTSITVVMHNYYKTLGKNLYYFRKSLIVLLISFVANSLAYYFYKTTIAISIASIITMIFWYIYAQAYFNEKYRIKDIRNFIYLVIMMGTFYCVTLIKNICLSAVVYLVTFCVITLCTYHKNIKQIVYMLRK